MVLNCVHSLKALYVSQVSDCVVFFLTTSLNPKRGQRSTLMISLILGFTEVFSHHARGKRGWWVRRGRRGLIRIFLSRRDDLHCRVNVPGSHRVWGIFQPQKRCWRHWRVVWRDLLSYCDGEGWGDFCLMAWGLYEVMRGLAALVFLPPVPGLHHWWVTPALSQLAPGRGKRPTSISVLTRSCDGREVRGKLSHSLLSLLVKRKQRKQLGMLQIIGHQSVSDNFQ